MEGSANPGFSGCEQSLKRADCDSLVRRQLRPVLHSQIGDDKNLEDCEEGCEVVTDVKQFESVFPPLHKGSSENRHDIGDYD